MGDSAKERIERELARGPFVSIKDFVYRTELNQLALEQLALVGAFAPFGVSRRRALWTILSIARQSPDELEMETGDTGEQLLPDMDILEELAIDFKGMDLSIGPHPMSLVRGSMKRRKVFAAADLREVADNSRVKVAGMVVIRQRPMTAKGFLFLTMEDETGFSNIVVKPNFVTRFRQAVMFAGALIVTGMVEKKDGVINVIGHNFEPFTFDRREISVKSRDFR
jgi:error-prone DNA polymerase